MMWIAGYTEKGIKKTTGHTTTIASRVYDARAQLGEGGFGVPFTAFTFESFPARNL